MLLSSSFVQKNDIFYNIFFLGGREFPVLYAAPATAQPAAGLLHQEHQLREGTRTQVPRLHRGRGQGLAQGLHRDLRQEYFSKRSGFGTAKRR